MSSDLMPMMSDIGAVSSLAAILGIKLCSKIQKKDISRCVLTSLDYLHTNFCTVAHKKWPWGDHHDSLARMVSVHLSWVLLEYNVYIVF